MLNHKDQNYYMHPTPLTLLLSESSRPYLRVSKLISYIPIFPTLSTHKLKSYNLVTGSRKGSGTYTAKVPALTGNALTQVGAIPFQKPRSPSILQV